MWCLRCGRRRNKARSRKIERALKRHFEKMSSSSSPPLIDTGDTSDSDSHVDSDDSSSEDGKTDNDVDSLDDDEDNAEVANATGDPVVVVVINQSIINLLTAPWFITCLLYTSPSPRDS